MTSIEIEDALSRPPGELRELIPPLGLRNYWYPALADSSVSSKKPTHRRLLGEDICFFRGESGAVAAIGDYCPHRGARLSMGDCHYQGTVACPYHGWVFDERGALRAVLSEGPACKLPGKKGTEAKVYPTRTLCGVVFVWIGDDAPAPIEEDVPEEFFLEGSFIQFNDRITWPQNWAMSLENALDSHVNYVHRNNVRQLLGRPELWRRGATGSKPHFTGNGFSGELPPESPPQDIYPNGWKWPKTLYRRHWWRLFAPLFDLTDPAPPPPVSERWGGGHRLPSMFRAPLAPLFGVYTRWNVPIDEGNTRVWYFHYTKPRSTRERLFHQLSYWGLHRWLTEYNFSQQDLDGTFGQRWDLPEKLSSTDAELIQWRRLLVVKHLGGRYAELKFNERSKARAPEETDDGETAQHDDERARNGSAGPAGSPLRVPD